MHSVTFEQLWRLHHRHGPREFGKQCQKLLAICFHRAGFGHIVERGVQGVDVDAADGAGSRYTTEVKTTLGDAIQFQEKDAVGLTARRADGYAPVLAALRLSPLTDWLLVDAAGLRPGRLQLDALRAYRLYDLEVLLRPHFSAVVEEHGEAVLRGGQAHLDAILKKLGIKLQEGQGNVGQRGPSTHLHLWSDGTEEHVHGD